MRGLPNRRHFKFFYNPILPDNPTPFVLLDVVEEQEVPHEVIKKLITPAILEIEREVSVTIPTIESLLADKLTAFAPKTIGIPFIPPGGRDADTMQIIKQLFDVGELFDIAEDISAIRRVYHRVFEQENQYRGGGFTHVQTLDDTLDAAHHLSKHSLKGVAITPEAEKMTDGVRKVSEHLINYSFNLNVAKIAAAKAALLSRLVLSEGKSDSLTYWRTLPTTTEISTLTIDGPWDRLHQLRRTSLEAFYYWQQAAKLQATLSNI